MGHGNAAPKTSTYRWTRLCSRARMHRIMNAGALATRDGCATAAGYHWGGAHRDRAAVQARSGHARRATRVGKRAHVHQAAHPGQALKQRTGQVQTTPHHLVSGNPSHLRITICPRRRWDRASFQDHGPRQHPTTEIYSHLRHDLFAEKAFDAVSVDLSKPTGDVVSISRSSVQMGRLWAYSVRQTKN
jgi:hypothetical protein